MAKAESIMETLRQIKALIDNPGTTEGERQAAISMYQKLLQKYHITADDLVDDTKYVYEYKYVESWELRLMLQLAALNHENSRMAKKGKTTRKIYLEFTRLQKAEFDTLYAFYRPELENQINQIYTAFLFVNDLMLDGEPDKNRKPLNLEEARSIAQKIAGMRKTIVNKLLPGRGE